MVKVLKYCWYCNHNKRVGSNGKYCPTCGSILNRKSKNTFTNNEEQQFETLVRATYKENFSPKERKILTKNIDISLNKSDNEKVGGMLCCGSLHPSRCTMFVNLEGVKKKPKNEITKSIITHESIHALRKFDNKRKKGSITKKLPPYYFGELGNDHDLEEALTEAESITREKRIGINSRIKHSGGYYQKIKGSKFPQNLKEDKQTLSGKHDNNIGTDALNRLEIDFLKLTYRN